LNTDIYMVHLAKRFQRRRFLEIDQSETRIACGSHVCWWIGTKWAIFIENLPRMLHTKFQFIWPSDFRREDFFRNQPIRNKNGLWRPCLLTDRDEMSNLHRGPAIDASYQVSVHLAKRFQRKRSFTIGQSETRIAYGSHVCWWIGTKWAIVREDLP
jgi:hypothetical protein